MMADTLSYREGTQAGWKGNKETGRRAAFAVSQDLPRRHAQVMAAFAPYGPAGATCDEIGEELKLPVHLVRPRASELEKRGKLFAVGRRPGRLGHKVTVYSVVEPDEREKAA